MAQFFTLLTEVGQAKLANAIALGQTIEITQLAVGDGGGSLPTPQGDEEQLINEVRRAAINSSHVDPDNPTWIVVEQVIPPDVGGWTIREVGIFDSAGDLIAYGNYPETYKPVLEEGSSRTQTVRFVLEVSDTAAVTLKVDPSVVLATREYVDDRTQVATQVEVDAGTDDTTAVTPKKLRWGVSLSIGSGGYLAFPSWLGGLIFQWGSATTSGSGDITVNLPIEYPGDIFGVSATLFRGAGTVPEYTVVGSRATTSFTLGGYDAAGARTVQNVFWLSMGH